MTQAPWLLFVGCVLSGIAIPVPEDVPLLAAGAAMSDPAELPPLLLAGLVGVFLRDAAFFFAGHWMGEAVLSRPLVQRLIGEARLERARGLVERRGALAVLMGRFLIGFRTAAFLVAGASGVRPRDFLLWDGLGLTVSVPLWLGLGWLLGDQAMAALEWVLANRRLALGLAVVLAVVFFGVRRALARRQRYPEGA